MYLMFKVEDGEVTMGVEIFDSSGEIFKEYAYTFSDDNGTAQCWIPSVEGKVFEIRWGAHGPKSYSNLDVQATPYLDGREMDSGILSANQWAQNLAGWLDGHQVGVNKACPFQFATLELTDSQSKAEQVCLEDLHTIRVELDWGQSQPQNMQLKKNRPKFSKLKTKGPIYEKEVKKGNYSCTRLGQPIPSNAPSYLTFRPVKTDIGRITFIFHYASADWLQANAINIGAPGICLNNGVNKEIIDVDETVSELELEEQPEPGTEMEDSSIDEIQVEAMIVMDSDPVINNKVKLELDDCVAQTKEDTDKEFEDEDVFIYKIMVPVFNFGLPSGDTKVKLEPSDL